MENGLSVNLVQGLSVLLDELVFDLASSLLIGLLFFEVKRSRINLFCYDRS